MSEAAVLCDTTDSSWCVTSQTAAGMSALSGGKCANNKATCWTGYFYQCDVLTCCVCRWRSWRRSCQNKLRRWGDSALNWWDPVSLWRCVLSWLSSVGPKPFLKAPFLLSNAALFTRWLHLLTCTLTHWPKSFKKIIFFFFSQICLLLLFYTHKEAIQWVKNQKNNNY